jgi:hypothetical protein
MGEPAASGFRIEVKTETVDSSIMLVTIRMTEEYHNPEDQNPT